MRGEGKGIRKVERAHGREEGGDKKEWKMKEERGGMEERD